MWGEITYPFQTATVQPLKFGNGSIISPTLNWACDYLSKLGLRLVHVSKRGSMKAFYLNTFASPLYEKVTHIETLIVSKQPSCHEYNENSPSYVSVFIESQGRNALPSGEVFCILSQNTHLAKRPSYSAHMKLYMRQWAIFERGWMHYFYFCMTWTCQI